MIKKLKCARCGSPHTTGWSSIHGYLCSECRSLNKLTLGWEKEINSNLPINPAKRMLHRRRAETMKKTLNENKSEIEKKIVKRMKELKLKGILPYGWN
jgi:recombinational DNA repair protein (RecF pathway)